METEAYGRGNFLSALYSGISSIGACLLFCLSFFLSLASRIFGRPFYFIKNRLRRLFSSLRNRIYHRFYHQDGRRKYFTGRLKRSLKSVLALLPRHPIRALAVFYGYADKGTRVYAPVIKALLCTVIPLIALFSVVFTADTLLKLNSSLVVNCNGEAIGCVENESVYFQARTLANNRVSLAGGSLPKITYSVSLVPVSSLTDARSLAQALIEKSDVSTITACGIYIDGDFLCAVASETAARRVFNSVTDSFEAENKDDIIGFVEDITYETGLYPNTTDIIWSTDKLSRRVLSDSSLLTVKAVRTVVENRTVSFPTVYIETDSLVLGSERIVVTGLDGVDQVTSFVTYVDGDITDSNEVARLTVISPVTQRIQTGTREPGEDGYNYYGGILVWPTLGATNINSTYGYRWGKLHAGLDLGCAYGTSYGKSVVAAADGTVIISSYNSISGYYVKIDHGNGLQTLYAHMQRGSVCVNVGERVYAGEQIGKIGATGFVTGPHLHFEVWKNGSRVDPAQYLGLY